MGSSNWKVRLKQETKKILDFKIGLPDGMRDPFATVKSINQITKRRYEDE